MRRNHLFMIGFLVLWLLSFSVGEAAPRDATARIPWQSVRVGDIDIGYRITGQGEPLVLITGYSATMDLWDPQVIKELSSRYQVITFDNRGIGRSGTSGQAFSIGLFVEDTVGLMDALKIKKAHVLGWSMGTFIATELALKYPDRVDKMILYAGNCGWNDKEVAKSAPEVSAALMNLSGTAEERGKRWLTILFPQKWSEENPGFAKNLPRPEVPPSLESIERQGKAIGVWTGTCGRLDRIVQPTLVITGTEDVIIPSANSLLLASRIPGSWLIRIPGGHANMYQYPGLFSRCLLAFLEARKDR